MSTSDHADRIIELLRNPAHAEQAVSILESLDDPEVARLVVRAFENGAGFDGVWHGATYQVRGLIACGSALHAIRGKLARVRLSPAQLALPRVERVLRFCRELAVGSIGNDGVDALITLPPMPVIESLRLRGVHVDLGALATSPALRTLAVHGRVNDAFVSLHPEARLRSLQLHEAHRLTSLDALETQSELEQLEITGAQLADLAPLASLTKLRILDLRSCSVPSLAPLANLAELRVLAVDGTGHSPADIPSSIRPYATWSPQPPLESLAKRPVHPDARDVL